MITASAGFLPRIHRLRRDLDAAQLDALVVTHLPNVRYLTGFAGSAGLVLLTPSQCLLVADFRYATAARTLSVARPELSGHLSVVVPEQSYDETLVALLHDMGARRIGIEAGWMPVGRFNRISAALAAGTSPPLNLPEPCPALVPTDRMVERYRAVKDADEIATLREAARRLAGVAAQVPSLARPGRSEIEVAAEIEAQLRTAGFERPAFDTIVASGPNSALPHARPGRRILDQGEGVVLDFGGVYDGYSVDLTRTVELGDAGPGFRRLFDAVAQAQQAAIAAVKPGVPASQVDAAARDVLQRHGLAAAFGHGTGHGIGLEVHEEPRVGRVVSGHIDAVLEAGMVFTIEPGAYLEGVGGVRIEDDVLVTEGGCEVLTRL